MKKRVISIILALIMICTLLPMSAFAATVIDSGACGENVTWTLDSEGTLTISGTGDVTSHPWSDSCGSKITSAIIESGITSICYHAFSNCNVLTNINVASDNPNYSSADGVLFNKDKTELISCPHGKAGAYTIPKDVRYINDYAFEYSDLTNVTIPSSVTNIGWYAFYNCMNLQGILIPSSVTNIGWYAFYNCRNLTGIAISDGVESIGPYAFNYCPFTDIYLPRTVEEIGLGAFDTCYHLTRIDVASDNLYFSSDDGVLFNKNKTALICYPAGKSGTTYSFPSGVKEIKGYAFSGSNIEKIIIPNSVTEIGNNAFSRCFNLVNVKMLQCGKWLESGMFDGCRSLIRFNIPDSVTYIGAEVFNECDNLESVYIPSGVKEIGDHAFAYCDNLKEVYYGGTEEQWNAISFGTWNEDLKNASIHYNSATPKEPNIYNLGEETYSFPNYKDAYSDGHCFGMAMTSAGYYLGYLDPAIVGSEDGVIYNLELTKKVKAPIRYYHSMQGSNAISSFVAGGAFYLSGEYNTVQDWKNVVEYVKSHHYDDMGNLVLLTTSKDEGHHALNFLRYSVVDGEERIYVYDSNCPEKEAYFYMDNLGDICEKPYSTFDTVECIALCDVDLFFSNVGSYISPSDRNKQSNYVSHAVIAEKGTIFVEGAKEYCYFADGISGEQVVFEIPESTEKVSITPLVDNATFTYIDTEYTLDKADGKTVGVLKLSDSIDENNATLTIEKPHVCPFDDIADSAHHKNIETAFERGYVSGYGEGKYAPNETVTRAQFITMLWRAAGKPAPEKTDLSFTDISDTDYCREAIAWGAEKGIVSGYDANTFGRNDPVTRAQATTFIARYCDKVVGMTLNTTDYGFLDINDAREAFRPYINAMANAGIILGYGTTCGPNDKATRGQIASILVRAMDTIG